MKEILTCLDEESLWLDHFEMHSPLDLHAVSFFLLSSHHFAFRIALLRTICRPEIDLSAATDRTAERPRDDGRLEYEELRKGCTAQNFVTSCRIRLTDLNVQHRYEAAMVVDATIVRRHDAALDGVRGIAILAVLGLHFDIVRGGFIGVDIFFVLSGFLITSILKAEIDQTGCINYSVFFAKRLLRLIPALLICLIGAAIVSALRGQALASVVPLIAAGTYMMNYVYAYHLVSDSLVGHTWSLAVEMQFYLVWPVLLLALCRKLDDRGIVCVTAFLALACTAWRAILSLRYGEASVDFTYRVLETRCDPLLMGGVVALLLQRGVTFTSRIAFALACMFMIAVLWRVPAGKVQFHAYGFTLVGLATAYAVGFLSSSSDHAVRRIFENRLLCYLGRISYGIYLYHFPIVEGLRQGEVAHAAFWAVPMTLCVAALSFHFVEAPILKLKPRAPQHRDASTVKPGFVPL